MDNLTPEDDAIWTYLKSPYKGLFFSDLKLPIHSNYYSYTRGQFRAAIGRYYLTDAMVATKAHLFDRMETEQKWPLN